MSYQQCYFNFGQVPFKYPPKKYKFKNFNSEAIIMDKDDYKIVPMYVPQNDVFKNLIKFIPR